MKILVLGAGAIGGYLGGRLTAAGADVTFLLRATRRDQLNREGLRIRSIFGDLDCPVATISADAVRPDHDLVIVTCKAYDLDSAIEAIGPGLASNGMVLPILNGRRPYRSPSTMHSGQIGCLAALSNCRRHASPMAPSST